MFAQKVGPTNSLQTYLLDLTRPIVWTSNKTTSVLFKVSPEKTRGRQSWGTSQVWMEPQAVVVACQSSCFRFLKRLTQLDMLLWLLLPAPETNYRCFLVVFRYLKASKKHLLEGLGRKWSFFCKALFFLFFLLGVFSFETCYAKKCLGNHPPTQLLPLFLHMKNMLKKPRHETYLT